jgi:hypothetical protein
MRSSHKAIASVVQGSAAGTRLASESRDGSPQEISHVGGNSSFPDQAHQRLIPPQHTPGIKFAECNQVRITELITIQKAPQWTKGVRRRNGKFGIE